MKKAITKINLIFEVSWEVCNKVGGIYTVLSSKSHALCGRYPDKLIFIGPLFDSQHQNSCFIEDDLTPQWAQGLVLPEGLTFKTGRWDVPGKPSVVLVDFKFLMGNLNGLYGEMWNEYGVDSLHAYGDYEESCAFSVASAMMIGALYKKNHPRNAIALFNEWTTGMGLLYLKKHFPKIATLFTTHATSIGRSICGNNKPLYGYFKCYNGDQMAQELNMQSKHSLEKAAAHNANCFTAVSELTAAEAEQLLEIRPKVVTPNGFEKEISGSAKERSAHRASSRKKILNIAGCLLDRELPSDTFIVAISGRNEYRNKGLDVYLDVVNRMRERNEGKNLLFLVLVPAWVKEPRNDLHEKLIDNRVEIVGNRILTHWLNNPQDDSILRRIEELSFNNKDENINVIYLPSYLDGKDGILDIQYYDFLPALDLTVFPSYYEPWGYTPLESIAFGVPTVTTSLSGFGQWIKSQFAGSDFKSTGVAVVERDDFNYQQVVDTIAGIISKMLDWPASTIQKLRRNAVKTADSAQWELFIEHYIDAYQTAIENNKESEYK